MSFRGLLFNLAAASLSLLLCFVAGCGQVAPGIDTVTGPDQGLTPADREVSSTFSKFFADSVNNSSKNRWTVEDAGGAKSWQVADMSGGGDECWVIGRNYKKGENDTITSAVFPVPANRHGIRLSFYEIHSLGAGDSLQVQYRTDPANNWDTLSALTGANVDGQNWTKLTFALADTGNLQAQYQLRFIFSSDSQAEGWGCALNKISVYQTNLDPPTDLQVSLIGILQGHIQWTAPVGGMYPDHYAIYRATALGGNYVLAGTVATSELNPVNEYVDDGGGVIGMYFYKVVSVRDGYPDSDMSSASAGLQLL